MSALSIQPRLAKLEALRGFASLYVFIYHCRFSQGRLRWVFGYGYSAVMLFFILSGFVICYSTASLANPTFKDYFRRRLRRIYPIFLIALLFTHATKCIVGGKLYPVHVGNLLGNVFLLQDSVDGKDGVWFDAFEGNAPLWSLSYEWWFYMMFFGLMTLVPRWPRAQSAIVAGLSLGGVLSYLAFANQISLFLAYFGIWWSGVELAREFLEAQTISFRRQWPMVLLLGIGAALWLTAWTKLWPAMRIKPLPQTQHALSALLALVLGLIWCQLRFVGFRALLGWFAILAPISYALYVLHLPALRYGEMRLFAEHRVLKYGLIPVGLFGLAYLLEVRLQPTFNALIDRLFRKPQVARPSRLVAPPVESAARITR